MSERGNSADQDRILSADNLPLSMQYTRTETECCQDYIGTVGIGKER